MLWWWIDWTAEDTYLVGLMGVIAVGAYYLWNPGPEPAVTTGAAKLPHSASIDRSSHLVRALIDGIRLWFGLLLGAILYTAVRIDGEWATMLENWYWMGGGVFSYAVFDFLRAERRRQTTRYPPPR